MKEECTMCDILRAEIEILKLEMDRLRVKLAPAVPPVFQTQDEEHA